jgi:hypothetical protein
MWSIVLANISPRSKHENKKTLKLEKSELFIAAREVSDSFSRLVTAA